MFFIQLDSVEISYALNALNHIPFRSLVLLCFAWLFFSFIRRKLCNLLNGCHSGQTNNLIRMYTFMPMLCSFICLSFCSVSSSFTRPMPPLPCCFNALRIILLYRYCVRCLYSLSLSILLFRIKTNPSPAPTKSIWWTIFIHQIDYNSINTTFNPLQNECK